ncbi:hypothetical protein VF14_31795 [Nostoc linckia z18]|uniref:Telomere resolvase ResT/TelK catalytic domain-containing protein n=2 Tax=Nostoc linckia TaxID=92942 RepID=A0A9Q5Z5U0_NOSLI|nr:protelomerase family protein [Nostoc linckia]PHK34608.1 hypothetical protein VF12_23545 [Nostoc linckia z15]PHK41171.1 hypothetical protein VF13_31650 [Nostoc linckia z16]PHJ55779.1 hypothetical protein VF02_35410 [Nostoc linckia z1]PHJ56993.1 hypothetical protein VF05_36430 [Nostoc linckia z3]PHJ58287.1 hypothetical protein VF03_35615 [Nostoc linckia z2]
MVDTVTENRKKYATYSKEDLENLTSAELRKIAPEVGVQKIYNPATKSEQKSRASTKELLIPSILEACETERKLLLLESNTGNKEENKDMVTTKDTEEIYSDFETEINEIATKFYEGIFDNESKTWEFLGLKPYTTRLVTTQQTCLPEFFSIIPAFRSEIISRIESRCVEAKPNNISNWRAQVLKIIEQKVDADNENYPDNILSKTFSDFRNSVQASFNDIRRIKAEKSNENLNTRSNNAINIKVSGLINWAKGRLTHLPESSSKWQEVAIALMILTGRRQSEIMSSAKFTPVGSDNKLEFSGQLKRHAEDSIEAFEIPILGNTASAVLEGMKWLEVREKRAIPEDESFTAQQKAAKKAHDKYSRYLSEVAKTICDKYIILDSDATWLNPEASGKMKDRRTCHLFRQIYGQCVYPVFFENSGRKINQVLTDVMGHSNTASSRRHAAEAYDADCFVLDIESVKTISI